MRPIRSLLLYLLAVFLLGALLAPWLYRLAQWAAGEWGAFERIARSPFHRFVNRALLGLALLGLWPFLRSLGVNSWRETGLVKPWGQGRNFAGGFALGFASLAGVAALALVCGARTLQLDHSAGAFAREILKAAASAMVVAVMEELLFRGVLFGALRRAHRWGVALAVSSGIYALVHFFQRPESPAQVTWSSGLEILPRMLRGFVEIERLVPGFFSLTLAGAILGLAFQRTGNLYRSIGLHAGWIFWLKFYGFLTLARPESNLWFWGTGKLVDGWLALILLLPVFAFEWSRQRTSSAHAE